MKQIFEFLEVDKANRFVNQTITKKMIFESVDLTYEEQKIIKDHILSLKIKYIIDSSNINIDKFINNEFNYMGICFLVVNLKNPNKIQKISEILQKSLPNPLIIFFEFEDKFMINSNLKRVNQNDNKKVVLGENNLTDFMDFSNLSFDEKNFLDSIKLSNLDFTNFYKFYESIDGRIYNFKNKEVFGKFSTEINNQEIKDKILKLDIKLQSIVSKIKKENRLDTKVKLNIEATKTKQEIENLKERLWKN